MHIPASVRFQRFRGLRSFRTSPWDPYENLPVDYAKIFGFRNYEQTGRKVMQEAQEEGVQVRLTLGVDGFRPPLSSIR
jgi:pre-rRNA-processing protein TSR1